jgi:hypothetical protein
VEDRTAARFGGRTAVGFVIRCDDGDRDVVFARERVVQRMALSCRVPLLSERRRPSFSVITSTFTKVILFTYEITGGSTEPGCRYLLPSARVLSFANSYGLLPSSALIRVAPFGYRQSSSMICSSRRRYCRFRARSPLGVDFPCFSSLSDRSVRNRFRQNMSSAVKVNSYVGGQKGWELSDLAPVHLTHTPALPPSTSAHPPKYGNAISFHPYHLRTCPNLRKHLVSTLGRDMCPDVYIRLRSKRDRVLTKSLVAAVLFVP